MTAAKRGKFKSALMAPIPGVSTTTQVAGQHKLDLIHRKVGSVGRLESILEELRKGNKYDQNTLYKIFSE